MDEMRDLYMVRSKLNKFKHDRGAPVRWGSHVDRALGDQVACDWPVPVQAEVTWESPCEQTE